MFYCNLQIRHKAYLSLKTKDMKLGIPKIKVLHIYDIYN